MDPQSITEKRFAGSSKGLENERRAARFLETKNWRILYHDIQIAGVQVDLVARDCEGSLHLVEVKSGGAWERGVISAAQRARLRRAFAVLGEQEPTSFSVVVVDGPEIEWIEAADL